MKPITIDSSFDENVEKGVGTEKSLFFEEYYFDRVRVRIHSLKFSFSSDVEFHSILDALNKELFRFELKSSTYAKLMARKGLGFHVTKANVVYERNVPLVRFYLQVSLNPLKELSKYFNDCIINAPSNLIADGVTQVFEESLDRNTNYVDPSLLEDLGPDDIRDRCCKALEGQINGLVSRLKKCLDEVTLGGCHLIGVPKIFVQEVEVTRDICVAESTRFVLELADSFLPHFQYPDLVEFPVQVSGKSEWRTSKGYMRNSLCLKGRTAKGVDYKVYSKTPHLVRLETTFDSKALESRLESKLVSPPFYWGFQRLLDDLTPEVRDVFSKFKAGANQSEDPKEMANVVQRIANSTKPEEFLFVVELLASKGGISRSKSMDGIINKLMRNKVIERCGRGIYKLSERDLLLLRRFVCLLHGFNESVDLQRQSISKEISEIADSIRQWMSKNRQSLKNIN